MLPIMGEALVSSLVSEGFTKKAKQIEAKLGKLYNKMYQQEQKLQRNLSRNASASTISNRMKKVNNNQKAYLKGLGKYAGYSGLQQGTSSALGRGTGNTINNLNDGK